MRSNQVGPCGMITAFLLPAALALLVLLTPQTGFSGGWKQVRSGMWVGAGYSVQAPFKGSQAIPIAMVKIDPGRLSVRVVDVYRLVNSRASGRRRMNPQYSLGEVIAFTKPLAIINGGFVTSFAKPFPVGLLVSGGRKVSNLAVRESIRSNIALTGVLCIRNNRAVIVERGEYMATRPGCQEALQCGPMLIESGGRPGISKKEPFASQAYNRSVAATDRQGNLILLATRRQRHLLPIAQFLARMGCTAALNLGGSDSSGLYVNTGRGIIKAGFMDSPNASAIAVYPRR